MMTTRLRKRLENIFKKAKELSILCEIQVCVIYYGPNGELKTWPKEIEKVRDMALRYKKATKRKNCVNLHEFLKKRQKKNLKEKPKRNNGFIKYPDWHPIFDHYSPQQLSQLVQSLKRTLFTLQERFCFVEKQSQNLVHQSQPLNSDPNSSQFSLYMYNHGDATLSQLPLSASLLNQLTTNFQNLVSGESSYGFDQNNTNFQHPCLSSTQDYSALLSPQESVTNLMQQKQNFYHNMCMDPCLSNPNYGLSNTQDYSALLSPQESGLKNHHLMMQKQPELYGFDQSMSMMSDITTNNNVLEHSYELCSDLQKKNPNYGDMVGSSNPSFFSQDMFLSYDDDMMNDGCGYIRDN